MRAVAPLAGFRVLDFTENMAGPFGTMILSDQGADVVKVEPPRGDVLRKRGTGSEVMGAYFANLNRSKRSLAIDLTRPESRPLLDRLLADADVVVQSFRPAASQRLGIDAAAVRGRYPGIVHVSILGFGSKGPLAGKAVYDHVIQAMSGMASLQTEGDGAPRLTRHGLVDKTTGYSVAQSACAALLARSRTGVGQSLEITMLDVALHLLWPDGMMDHTALEPAVRLSSVADTFRLTPTADGHVAMVVLTDRQWSALATGVEVDDNRVSRGDLLRRVRQRLATMPTADVVDLLHRNDVACGPVLDRTEVLEHPQVVANGSLGLFEHTALGTIRQPYPVPRFDGFDPAGLRPAPMLGEHSAEVLRDIGLNQEEIDALVDAGVVTAPVSDATA